MIIHVSNFALVIHNEIRAVDSGIMRLPIEKGLDGQKTDSLSVVLICLLVQDVADLF